MVRRNFTIKLNVQLEMHWGMLLNSFFFFLMKTNLKSCAVLQYAIRVSGEGQIRVALPCYVLQRLQYALSSAQKSKSPACLLWNQKYPRKNLHGVLQKINAKAEESGYFTCMKFCFSSRHKLNITRCRCTIYGRRPV